MPTATTRSMGDADVATGPPDREVTRIGAYALCVDDGRILLTRIAPGSWSGVGEWTLPGGGLDFGEDPRDGALRELTEETGLRGEILDLADVLSWSDRWRHPRDGADEAYHGAPGGLPGPDRGRRAAPRGGRLHRRGGLVHARRGRRHCRWSAWRRSAVRMAFDRASA